MSKAIDEMLNSILEEFAVCKQAREELEAKALFRLLNYCPPPSANVPLLGNRLDFRWVVDARNWRREKNGTAGISQDRSWCCRRIRGICRHGAGRATAAAAPRRNVKALMPATMTKFLDLNNSHCDLT
jgi:hypothetical protein